jgi:hypothetical protein
MTKRNQKDYLSEGTTITAEYLITWIGEHQSICWPERNPLPEWFYPKIAETIAPTVRDITTRFHSGDEGRPFTEEENRGAVARNITLRIFKIWGRIRLGTLVCRRCGGKIMGENFFFDWNGSGPYRIWHTECYEQQQIDPQPAYAPPARNRTEAEQYRIDLDERRAMVQAERLRRERSAGTDRLRTPR